MKKNKLSYLFIMIILLSFSVNLSFGQTIRGDVKFWERTDIINFDEIGDCKAKTGDISSVFAKVEGGKLFLRITFDNMIIRKHNKIKEDLFQNSEVFLELIINNKFDKNIILDRYFDLKLMELSKNETYQLRTPSSNLWEMQTNISSDIKPEDMEFYLSIFVDGKQADDFYSNGKNTDAFGNCAFVHHGNQGLTYTEVFYGSPNGQSGLEGSGFDEVLQVHEATSIPGNFHMSGTLMPAAQWHNPEFNDWLTSLASQGIVSMMTSALGQHIMPFTNNNMNDWSVGVECDMVDYRYNYEPRTAWVPERVWLSPGNYPDAGVIDWLGDNWQQHGVWGVVLDDGPHLNGYDNRKIHWMNNGSGIDLRVIPINNSFVGNMHYDATAAKNQIAGIGQYNICVYGTDWEVAAEMNEHDGTFFLDNYESVLWYCYDNFPGVNVWKLEDAMMNSDFNGTGAEITPGTYGLLGGEHGYGGGNNSWYVNWASTASHSDFHEPKWNYGYVWSDAYNNIMTAPDNNLAQLAWYILMINLHETGWHTDGEIADWEHRYSSHIKNANVYAEASRWADGQYSAGPATFYNDIDHDGVDEVIIHNDKIFAVFESIGGKVNWLFYKNDQGAAYSVVGSDMAYWAETDGDYNESSNNHVAALSDVYPNQQNSIYEIDIQQSFGDTVRVNFSQWGVSKTIELTTGVNYLDVFYDFFDGNGYIKSGWSPGLMDLIWSGKDNIQRIWGESGSYCGQRNSASGVTVALILGNGGANHNIEFEGTLVKGDEITGYNQFNTRLFAGPTSTPSGTIVPELDILAAQNMDFIPPQLNDLAFQIDQNTVEITFSEAVDLATSQNISNYSLVSFSNNYTLASAVRQSDWRKVHLSIQENWATGDAGQIIAENIMDLNGNQIEGDNIANFTTLSGSTPHSINIDGTNDFDSDSELMDFDGYSVFITWDDQNLYIGFYEFDLNTEGDLFVNIDTDQISGSGAPSGSWGRVDFSNSFRPEYQVAIEGGGGSIQLNKWEAKGWQYPGSAGCNSYEGWQENGLTEISIPWSSLNDPQGIAVSVHVSEEDNQIIPKAFPIGNPTGNHPTLSKVYSFFEPYISTAMPVSGMAPNQAFVLPNLPPDIISFEPEQLNISMQVGETIDFSVIASDPEDDVLVYNWMFDDELVSEISSYSLIAEESIVGEHTLSAIVSDNVPNNQTDQVTWQIEISPGTQIQEFNLNAGYQIISSNIIPEEPNMVQVLSNILNSNLDFVRNSAGNMLRKIGPVWVNGIGDWVITEGYLVKMNSVDSFEISGELIDPQTPIVLLSGYQFISYLPENFMNALTAFNDILDNLDFVRNSAGNMLRKIGPMWVNGIGDLNPKEGYLVKMNDADNLVYPISDTKFSIINKIEPEYFSFEGGNAADPVFIIYVSGLEIGDEIAAFEGKNIIGAFKINSQNVFDNELPVFSTTNSEEGYKSGNQIILKVWDFSSQSIIPFEYEMISDYDDTYIDKVYPTDDGFYSVINIEKSLIARDNQKEKTSFYPNPAKDIIYLLPADSSLTITIFNSVGEKILYKSDISHSISISDLKTGVYYIKIQSGNNFNIKKLIIL